MTAIPEETLGEVSYNKAMRSSEVTEGGWKFVWGAVTSVKHYFWASFIRKEAPIDNVMLPTGDNHFLATQIYDAGAIRRKVILSVMAEGIQIVDINNEDIKEFWNWDKITQVQGNAGARCLWWFNEELATNNTFEDVEVDAVVKKIVEIMESKKKLSSSQ